MIQNLIWDIDGTLFDTYPAMIAAFQEALADFGVQALAEDVDPLARVSIPSCITTLAGRYGIAEDGLTAKFLEHYRAKSKEEQAPFPGAAAVCREIVCAGGANVIVTHRLKWSTEELLRVHELENLFVDIAAGDDGYPKKPDPGAFLALMERNRLDPAATATVGDREIDIQAGKAAGVVTCLFGAPPGTYTADFCFSDYQELMDYLLNGAER
jgi:HAD superfamily hydrolase (TIGR01549 family)